MFQLTGCCLLFTSELFLFFGPPLSLTTTCSLCMPPTCTADAVATFLTRRFGLAGGLAWLGVLAFGSIGEQIKTRMEVAEEEEVRVDRNRGHGIISATIPITKFLLPMHSRIQCQP